MKRWLSFTLAVFLLIVPLAACKKQEKVDLITDGKIVIAYDKDLLSSRDAQSAARAIGQKTGAETEISSVLSDAATVIIGDMDCDACRLACGTLRADDWTTGVYGGKYVVGARTAEALQKALEYFTASVAGKAEKGKLTLSSAENKIATGTYRAAGFTLGGEKAGRMAIVIPKNASASENRTAVLLREELRASAGYVVEVARGKAPAGTEVEIRVGASLCETAAPTGENGYAIAVKGKTIEIAAASQFGYEAAQIKFSQELLAAGDTPVALGDTSAWRGSGSAKATAPAAHAGEVRMMSHNVYGFNAFDNDEGYDNDQRMAMAAELYAYYQPDVLALQEFFGDTRPMLTPRLTAMGYAEVPVRAPQGAQNPVPLFYRTDTVELVKGQCGFYWYGETQYTNAAYTGILNGQNAETLAQKGASDNAKGATWAIFRHKVTGEYFLAASTHLWWKTDDAADEACRGVQICAIKEKLLTAANAWLESAGRGAEAGTLPLFVGGDMNTGAKRGNHTGFDRFFENTPTVEAGNEGMNTAFFDCNAVSRGASIPSGDSTHHEYADFDETLRIYQKRAGGREWVTLDYIFTAATAQNNVRVEQTYRVADLYAYLISDHCPIFADITLYPSK